MEAQTTSRKDPPLEPAERFVQLLEPILSPCGERVAVVAVTTEEGPGGPVRRRALRLIDAEHPGGRILVQTVRGSLLQPAFHPSGEWIYYISDSGPEATDGEGPEPAPGLPSVWKVPIAGGRSLAVTLLEGAVVGYRIAPSGDWILAVRALPRPPEFPGHEVLEEVPSPDVLVVRAADPLHPRVLPVKGHALPDELAIHPEEREVAVVTQPGAQTGTWPGQAITRLTPAGEILAFPEHAGRSFSPRYSPDGTSLAYLRGDARGAWTLPAHAMVLDLATGRTRALPGHDPLQPTLLGFDPASEHLVLMEGVGPRERLIALPLDGGEPAELRPPSSHLGSVRLSGGDGALVAIEQASDRPPEVEVLDLVRQTTRMRSRVQPEDAPLPGPTRLVRWRGPDDLEVEGLLDTPPTEGPHPLVCLLHGGPAVRFRDRFTGTHEGFHTPWCVADLVGDGFAVLRLNVRGSTGYGEAFAELAVGDIGGDDAGDVEAAVEHLVAEGVAARGRAAVAGWSYGGYLAAILACRSTHFRAAIVGAGISHLVSFRGTTDIPGFVDWYVDGRADWWKRSPIALAAEARTPTLILHGTRDRRVPSTQAHELYVALRDAGCRVRLRLYPGQGHDLIGAAALRDATLTARQWLGRRLKED